MPYRNSEDSRAYHKARYEANKEYYIEKARKSFLTNFDKNRERRAAIYAGLSDKEKRAIYKKNNASRRKLRTDVLLHYSAGTMSCRRCKFSDIRALSIDHIDGGGAAHRKNLKANGDNIYCWLRKNKYPEGFQVLCMNCQFIKRYENSECLFESWDMNDSTKDPVPETSDHETQVRYRGVSRRKDRWEVRITKNRMILWIGRFPIDQAIEAARNYDYHALMAFGRDAAILNFPDFDYSDFLPKRVLNYDVLRLA